MARFVNDQAVLRRGGGPFRPFGDPATLRALLFGQNEPGFAFEPRDITTLYQDRAGTTPVTAAGQSVGLRLDKSKGLALGVERGAALTLPGWTVTSGVTVSGGVAAFSSAAQNSNAYNVVGTVEVGKTYRVNLTVSSYVSGTAALLLPGGSGRGAITSNGTFTGIYTASSTGVIYLWAQGASNNTFVISDYSVRELAGTHEVAINDASRGIYGWMPKTGRRNLLTYSEQFDNAAWNKTISTTVAANAVVAPDGTATADTVTSGGAAGYIYPSTAIFAAAGGATYTYSTYIKAGTATSIQLLVAATATYTGTFNLSTGVASTITPNTTVSMADAGSGWYRCVITCAAVANTVYTEAQIGRVGLGLTFSIWGAQLELGSTATAYQRVASNYDITEAGVPSCYYVLANGVNTAYSTPTITPGTDKVQVFAGVRKNSDAARGVLFELSASTANLGTFGLDAPASATPTYGFGLSGSTTGAFIIGSGYTAPISSVLSVSYDIAGATLVSEIMPRINGSTFVPSSSGGSAGTGNFAAYPAYIYARGGTTLPFNGYDFGHAVRFGPNLDAATIARVEALIARNTPEVTL